MSGVSISRSQEDAKKTARVFALSPSPVDGLLRRPSPLLTLFVTFLTLEQFVHDGDELFRIHRFLQIEISEGFSGLERFCHIAGDDHNRHAGMVFRGLYHSATVGVAQSPVSYDGIVGVVAQFLDGITRGGARGHSVSGRFQNGALQSYNVGLVIHAKDVSHTGGSFHSVSASRTRAGERLCSYSQPGLGMCQLECGLSG